MNLTRKALLDHLEVVDVQVTTKKGPRRVIGATDDFAIVKDENGWVTLIPYADIYSLEARA